MNIRKGAKQSLIHLAQYEEMSFGEILLMTLMRSLEEAALKAKNIFSDTVSTVFFFPFYLLPININCTQAASLFFQAWIMCMQ